MYDAWAEGYKKVLQTEYLFTDEDSVKREDVGNWIVSARIIGGCQGIICIYNKETLREHYRTKTIGLSCSEDALQNIKDFYSRAFERDFNRVIEMAKSW